MTDKNDSRKVDVEEEEEEKDLDELLDSALKDFDKVDKKNSKTQSGEGSASKTTSSDNKSATDVDETVKADLPPDWNDEFVQQQAKLFEEKMSALFGGAGETPSTDQIAQGFQRMAEAASLALNPSTENIADPNFTQSITDALRGLSEGAEGLQAPFSPDDIADMFGNIDLSQSADNNPFLPFMQGMMQSLLSAEILLPSLQDLVSKYPEWLQKNAATVDPADKERYLKQMELMKSVISDLETEKAEDSAEVKQDRFQKVFNNMQKMQELGQPPADLIEIGPGIPGFDPTQLANSNQPQCPMM